ncbi:MAG: hypothetical protein NTV81_01695, partial [Candidatus Komeilibacteria bacterium]|nr:hypothetical protein [Candidatus Komeilibacteria bacterium]
RASRDSDWLSGNAAFASWNTWYDKNNPAYRAIFQNNSFVFQPLASADPATCGANCQVLQNSDSAWPVLGVEAGGSNTAFRRFFVLKPICWDSVSQATVTLAQGQDCSLYNSLAGYQVESTVAWQFGGGWKPVQIIEQLYDWK